MTCSVLATSQQDCHKQNDKNQAKTARPKEKATTATGAHNKTPLERQQRHEAGQRIGWAASLGAKRWLYHFSLLGGTRPFSRRYRASVAYCSLS